MNKLTVFGQRGNAISIVAHGDRGPTWLLVHGFPLDHRMWQHQLQEFSAESRVIAVELGGFGHSTLGAQDGYELVDLADDVEFVRRHLAAESEASPFILCGLSMGGYVAFEYLKRFPAKVDALVLTNTKPTADDAATQQNRLRVAQEVLKNGTAELAQNMPDKLIDPGTSQEVRDQVVEMILDASPEAVAASLKAMAKRPDSTGDLSNIDVPTLVIAGENDALMSSEATRGWSSSIPNATYRMVPGSGHLTPLEQPEQFNQIVKQWWKTIPLR